MPDPQVILIGGPPGAGKTTLARSVAARLGYAATTGDDLVVVGRVLTTPEAHPQLHRMRGIGHVRYFTESEPEALIADAEALADAMWPAFEAVIRRHLVERHPVVIDSWLLDPGRVAALDAGGIGSVWIHIDEVALDARERSLESFRAGSADPDRMHRNFMARSLWRNEVVADAARRRGLAVLEQPGHRTVPDLTDEVLGVLGVA